MKQRFKMLLLAVMLLTTVIGVQAQQKVDEERMDRDIEVARNVLSTLLRQQFGRRNFFPMEVEASYMPGFGVTFRLPSDFNQLMYIQSWGDNPNISYNTDTNGINMVTVTGTGNSYAPAVAGSYSSTESDCADCPVKASSPATAKSLRGTGSRKSIRNVNTNQKKKPSDSLKNAYNDAILQASKDFIADYGDMVSQLGADERIVITNKGEGPRNNWLWANDKSSGKMYLSMEVMKSDLVQFKQGKLSRDQFLSKIKTVNSETTEDLSPDLELLASIFNRAYQADLSKTYYLQEEVYYERLKDYGVIFDMHAYSSTVVAEDYMPNGTTRVLYEMPTLQLSGIDKDERLKRVKDLYPTFEKNILDDVLEYGKTVKSLKDNEQLIFNVKMTECKGCNIPSSIEISFKQSVLKDYSSGKLTKEAALAKATIKKGPNQ